LHAIWWHIFLKRGENIDIHFSLAFSPIVLDVKKIQSGAFGQQIQVRVVYILSHA